jgi:thiaminase (transcriptional activator TenA)
LRSNEWRFSEVGPWLGFATQESAFDQTSALGFAGSRLDRQRPCAGWGLSPNDLEQTPPAVEMLAYTRYVLDAGMRGDLLALKVALAPCVIGYAEIATRLASRPDVHAATNPYRVWIAEYAGAPYQEVAAKARAHLEGLADLYVTPAREAELIVIFKEATRLEADFWEMGWRAGQRVE